MTAGVVVVVVIIIIGVLAAAMFGMFGSAIAAGDNCISWAAKVCTQHINTRYIAAKRRQK